MKTTHTPGPWNYNSNTQKIWSEIERHENNPVICEMKNHHALVEEKEANAKLIAAAPQVLEALIEAEKHHQGAHSEIGNQIRAAIKKATE